MEQFRINLENIPEDGEIRFSGEVDSAFFDLPKGDAKPVGPLVYDLVAQVFDNELYVSGKISVPFEFMCVRTLQPFVRTIVLDPLHLSLEIGDKQVIDITEDVREEVIFAFPAYPRCDMADVPMPCEIDSSYLEMDKHPQDGVNNSDTDGNPGVWDALDSLQ